MDFVNDYSSEDEDSKSSTALAGTNAEDDSNRPEGASPVGVPQGEALPVRPPTARPIAAPTVSLTAGRPRSDAAASMMVPYTNKNGPRKPTSSASTDLILLNNPRKDVLYQPVHGPQRGADPAQRGMQATATIQRNMAVDPVTFAQERANFQRSGCAAAPPTAAVVGSEPITVWRTTLGYSRDRLEQMAASEAERRSKRPRVEEYGKKNRKTTDAELVHGSDDEAEYGVWGPPSAEEQVAVENTVTDLQQGQLAPEQLAERAYFAERDRQRGIQQDATDELTAQERLVERKMAHLLPPVTNANEGPLEPATTQFYGRQEFDYKGQSWMAPPAGLGGVRADGGAGQHRCFVPKQCVHRFALPSHVPNKGIHRIRLFPVTGHLLLSAGLDGTCHVWNTVDQQLMRTYTGHRAAVRDVQFNHDGTKFVSASFDRYLRLWDTASGKVLQTFGHRRQVPYVVQFYPHDDNFFVVGGSDKKIVTYNARTAEQTQEYSHHLAPVNAIVFVQDESDGTTKMVTSSDDKKILVWEWEIGVPIKYISDPTMHSMPCLVLHPSHRFFVGQSLDNTIVVFQAGRKFAIQKKKKFSGHIVSGYACEMAFSPDGQFLVSGDGTGSLFVWDWQKHKILQKFRAHSGGPAICCVWHPLEPSVVFTCGWDGMIKVWK